jgi:hypothetical protein
MKKVLLTVLGVFIVLIIVGVVWIYMNKEKLTNMAVEKGFSAMETAVLQNSPSDIPADEVKKIFEETVAKIKSGEFDKEKMQAIATTFQTSFNDQKLDSAEVVLIIKELKDFVEE